MRYVRINQQNFIDNELNGAIVVRSKLSNKYLKSKFEIDKQRYNQHRNYCVKLLHLRKQKYYESLDTNKITDYQIFGNTISSLFSNKSYSANPRLTLLEKCDILSEESRNSNTINKFVKSLVLEFKVEKEDNLLRDAIEDYPSNLE